MTGYVETFKSLHAEVDLKHCHIKEINGHFSYNWPVNEYIIWQSQKNDLQNIKRNIKALANNQEQIIEYLDVSLSVLNLTIKLLKTRHTKTRYENQQASIVIWNNTWNNSKAEFTKLKSLSLPSYLLGLINNSVVYILFYQIIPIPMKPKPTLDYVNNKHWFDVSVWINCVINCVMCIHFVFKTWTVTLISYLVWLIDCFLCWFAYSCITYACILMITCTLVILLTFMYVEWKFIIWRRCYSVDNVVS